MSIQQEDTKTKKNSRKYNSTLKVDLQCVSKGFMGLVFVVTGFIISPESTATLPISFIIKITRFF